MIKTLVKMNVYINNVWSVPIFVDILTAAIFVSPVKKRTKNSKMI